MRNRCPVLGMRAEMVGDGQRVGLLFVKVWVSTGYREV